MTTLVPARSGDPGDAGLPAGQAEGQASEKHRGWFARHPAWPIGAYLILYPLWWATGLADFMPSILIIPIGYRLYRWRAYHERKLRLPPGIGLWLIFLIIMLAGVFTISQTAPQTVSGPVSGRLISYGFRATDYIGVTLMLLLAGNLTEKELSRKRLAWWMGLLGIYTVAGGLGSLVDKHFQFTALLYYLLPKSLQNNNGFIYIMMHPGFAEVMTILGYAQGRVKAPFDYTNTWGEMLAILLPWLLVAWWTYGSRRERRWTVVVSALALICAVISLDRGLWVGAGCGILYLAVRFAARGRLGMLAGVFGVIALAGVIVVASPLQSLIQQRLQHGKSNASRSSLSLIAVQDAVSSPLIGYGDSRHELGSVNSIAVGKTANCNNCGSRDIGGNGQLWLLLISSGFLGTFFYLAFFAYGAIRYWRDPTPYGLAGVLVLLLGFVFVIVYMAIGAPLACTMLSYAILWKNERARRIEAAAAAAAAAEADRSGARVA
jgi:hypothetical protein